MMVRYRFPVPEDGSSQKLASSTPIANESLESLDHPIQPHPLAPSLTSSPPLELTSFKAETSASAAQLIGLVGPRSYLRTHRWVWLADMMETDEKLIELTLEYPPIHSAAFNLILDARLKEGFLIVSHLTDSVTLYKEIEIPRKVKMVGRLNRAQRLEEQNTIAPDRNIVCGVQFVILSDRIQRTVVTELWAEPVVEGPADPTLDENESNDVSNLFKEVHERLADEMVFRDRTLIEKLYTFDRSKFYIILHT
jgi:hypothetical protein